MGESGACAWGNWGEMGCYGGKWGQITKIVGLGWTGLVSPFSPIFPISPHFSLGAFTNAAPPSPPPSLVANQNHFSFLTFSAQNSPFFHRASKILSFAVHLEERLTVSQSVS